MWYMTFNENKNIWCVVFWVMTFWSGGQLSSFVRICCLHMFKVEASQYWKWADGLRGGTCSMQLISLLLTVLQLQKMVQSW